jgi:hypothetical protein
MKHDRKFWSEHVEAWHRSELTQEAYCRRHHLRKGTLGYWSSTLRGSGIAATQLVEVGRTEVKPQCPSCPIELAVGGRYLLRLWPGMDTAQLGELLSVLESR